MAVFDFHRKKGYADLYSLHSWCGILVFVLFFVQVSPCSSTALERGGEQGPNKARARCVHGRKALQPAESAASDRHPSGALLADRHVDLVPGSASGRTVWG